MTDRQSLEVGTESQRQNRRSSPENLIDFKQSLLQAVEQGAGTYGLGGAAVNADEGGLNTTDNFDLFGD